MASNTTPNFTKNGTVGFKPITAANTKSDGAGTIATDIFLVFTADATNGSFVEYVRFMPTATAAGTATTVTVGRVFLSTQASGATTSANTIMIAEVALPSVTADSTSAANNPIDVPINLRLPASMTILATNHAAPAANTAWTAAAFGGDY